MTITVPSDAVVTVNGVRTKTTGTHREFSTAAAADGVKSAYPITATAKVGGVARTVEASVPVVSGKRTVVDFNAALSEIETPRTNYAAYVTKTTTPNDSDPAVLFNMLVPDDAVVYTGSYPVRATGAERRLRMPNVDPTLSYTNPFTVEAKVKGKLRIVTYVAREVVSGTLVTLDFRSAFSAP
jgi:uncharacterized protein (TIGR03000 family)